MKVNLSNAQTIILILLFLVFLFSYLWPRNEITKSKFDVGHWPLSAKKHLQFSQTLFNNNKEDQAVEEYKKAKALYQPLSFLDLNQKTKKKLKKTEELIFQAENTRKKIDYWETVLKNKPHSRDILLNLTALSYKLWQDEKAQDYWQKAFYLDPNNKKVLELGEIIGVSKN